MEKKEEQTKKEKEHQKYLRQRERRLAYQKQNYLKKKEYGKEPDHTNPPIVIDGDK